MRYFAICALAAASFPAFANPSLEQALSRVPTLTDLCGAVPEAPTKVRGNSIHRPVRPEVKSFIQDTNDWLDCAAEKYVRIQQLVNGMQDDGQREALVEHLNKDFRAQYAELNDQTRILARRVNYRLTWEVRPVRPAVSSSGVGYSNSQANVLLRKVKKITYRTDVNRPIHDPSRDLLNWEPVEPLQFSG
ncbi:MULTISPECIES: hypothetical protein [Kordiimonas]|jgi:hypothetical protein|uniref:hypothetical protein n=1 Tax=Kordiimonas TaxID=288021 RepID=UPI00257F4EEC|nr:hypothetical protein [Kordiimonas sp. UBA4487]